MLKINQTLPTYISFLNTTQNYVSSSTQTENNCKKRRIIEASLAGLAVLGIAGVVGAKITKSDIFKVLEKNGLKIKDGVVVSSKTGDNFTGTLKFNSKAFGLEKETVSYIDGKTTEYLCHSCTGREIRGVFFKEGKPFIEVGNIVRGRKQQQYPIYEYNEKGIVTKIGDGAVDSDVSVFETVRKSINKK